MIRQMTIEDLAAAVEDRCAELDTAQPVYLVCGGSSRSMEAAGALDQGGFDARPIDGGTRGWIAAGRPAES